MKEKKTSLKALILGGLDPLGYSGLLADLEAFANSPIQAYSIATALTAQTKEKFIAWHATPISLFKNQLKSIPKVEGVKIGMLATPQHALILAQWLKTKKIPWVILDPVLASSSGEKLFSSLRSLKDLRPLLKQVNLLTPNLEEAHLLTSKKLEPIQMGQALLNHLRTNGSVLLKGGHAKSKAWVKDLLISQKGTHTFQHHRLPGQRRGTGCRLASLMLVELLKGKKIEKAYLKAWQRLKKRLWP